ncbi:MAG: hypothetical protein CM1200mP12_12280 [Gammaproteobacteria bacterium]|nr:MAG: hypothetical protein CM1200mP12_12280 [Gammaproteobacteria bacterium]
MKLELGNYEMEMIYHDPLIFTLKGVLTEEECQHFINVSSDKMKRSTVVVMVRRLKGKII